VGAPVPSIAGADAPVGAGGLRPAAYRPLRWPADDAAGAPAYRAGMASSSHPRTAVWASALAIGLFEVIGTFGAESNQPARRPIDAFALLLVLAGPVALAWRDRWPLTAVVVAEATAIVYIATGYPYGPIFLSAVVALFTAVQAGQRRAAWLLAGAGYVGLIVAFAVDPHDEHGTGTLELAVVAGWLIVVLAVSEAVRLRRAQIDERERAESEERQRRVGEQRLLLAQELHDVLAHNISMINVQASVALHLLDEQPEQARPALTTIKAASREALQELRGALDLLRNADGAPLTPTPRLADLGTLVDGVRQTGLSVRLDEAARPTEVPVAVEVAAYRIVQEALTNVTRHARATEVVVRVGPGPDGDGVTVEVTDDGVGDTSGTGPVVAGNGITGMRERVAALGGTLAAGRRPEGGFRVVAHLPGRTP